MDDDDLVHTKISMKSRQTAIKRRNSSSFAIPLSLYYCNEKVCLCICVYEFGRGELFFTTYYDFFYFFYVFDYLTSYEYSNNA